MRNLEEIRNDISLIDIKMRDLFIERMKYVKEVKAYKQQNNLEIEDKKREEYMKSLYSKDLKEYKEEYILLLEKILELSKNSMK